MINEAHYHPCLQVLARSMPKNILEDVSMVRTPLDVLCCIVSCRVVLGGVLCSGVVWCGVVCCIVLCCGAVWCGVV